MPHEVNTTGYGYNYGGAFHTSFDRRYMRWVDKYQRRGLEVAYRTTPTSEQIHECHTRAGWRIKVTDECVLEHVQDRFGKEIGIFYSYTGSVGYGHVLCNPKYHRTGFGDIELRGDNKSINDYDEWLSTVNDALQQSAEAEVVEVKRKAKPNAGHFRSVFERDGTLYSALNYRIVDPFGQCSPAEPVVVRDDPCPPPDPFVIHDEYRTHCRAVYDTLAHQYVCDEPAVVQEPDRPTESRLNNETIDQYYRMMTRMQYDNGPAN